MSKKSLVPLNNIYQSTAPTLPTLQAGDQYFDTALGQLQIYSGTGWISPNQQLKISVITAGVVTGASLSGSTLTYQNNQIGGITVPTGSRFLIIKNSNPAYNGIWVKQTNTSPATAIRATDADSATEIAGAIVSVTRGTNAGVWACTNFESTSTVNTTAQNWYEIDSFQQNNTTSNPSLIVQSAPTSFGGAGAGYIVGISGNGTTVTYTLGTGVNSFVPGELITVTNANIAGYNVTNAPIVTSSGDTITITNSTTGTFVFNNTETFSVSQSANLTEWKNAAGTVVASVSPTGTFTGTFPASSLGYTTTVTSGTTVTLTNASTKRQVFTGSTAQNVNLPVASTLTVGDAFYIINDSTAIVTVRSSGANTILAQPAGTMVQYFCILASGTTAASWSDTYDGFNTITGTGNNVLATSPTLVTPTADTLTLTGATLAINGTTPTISSTNASAASIFTTTVTGVTVGTTAIKTTAYPIEVSGTTSGTVTTSAQLAGFLGIPQNPRTATGTFSYTLVSSDAGKHIYYTGTPTSAALVIPANSAVTFEIGTTFVVMNDLGAATNVSISITTDTLQLAGTGTTGTRTLARYGVATCTKVTATKWIISGNGLT
jgi:hypothetical protein